MGLKDAPRYLLAVPLFGMGIAHCAAYGLLWGSWRLVSLFLPAKYYPKGDDFMFERYQQLIIFLVETLGGSQLVLYGDYKEVLQKKEKVIWLSNHQSAADWIVCEMVALKQGSLGGVRYILKDTIKYIPLFGWYFPQHSCVFVRRSGTQKDLEDIQRQLHVYPRLHMDLWLVIFPEGTRYNPAKPKAIEKSQQYAQKLDLPVLKHHLTPRVKAAYLSVNALRGYVDAVYDVTIAYEEKYLPTDLSKRNCNISASNFALGFFNRVHVRIKRIDMRDPPSTEEELQRWLHEKFQQKDKDLEHFYSSDMSKARKFEGEGFLCPKSTSKTLKTICFWTAASALLLLTPQGLWIWKRSWPTMIVLGSLYAVLKR